MTTAANKIGSQPRRSTSSSQDEGRAKPVITPEYIVGLTDGEGCFYVQIRESDRYQAGATVHLHFHIKMKAEDEQLLENVKKELGCGEVYFQNDNRSNHANCYRFSVSSHRDVLQHIIPFFKEYPLQSASKQASFAKFCKIAKCIENKEHLTKEGIGKIRNLKKGMNK